MVKIRIGTWNMAHWSHKAFHKEAWDFYLNSLNCDILLFQESVPDYEALHKDNLVWDEIGGSRPVLLVNFA